MPNTLFKVITATQIKRLEPCRGGYEWFVFCFGGRVFLTEANARQHAWQITSKHLSWASVKMLGPKNCQAFWNYRNTNPSHEDLVVFFVNLFKQQTKVGCDFDNV